VELIGQQSISRRRQWCEYHRTARDGWSPGCRASQTALALERRTLGTALVR